MQALFAETCIGITDIKKNPFAAIREAGQNTEVVLHHKKPSAYLVPVKTYEVTMEIFDDLQLAVLIQARLAAADAHPAEIVKVLIADLERAAKAKLKVKPRMLFSS